VVRQNYTLKPQITIIEDLYRHKKVPNLSILVNDVKKGGRYGYGYGYSYGYGYGHTSNGYYTDDKNSNRKRWKIKKGKL
jgi:hypothetical protein